MKDMTRRRRRLYMLVLVVAVALGQTALGDAAGWGDQTRYGVFLLSIVLISIIGVALMVLEEANR